MLDKNSDPRYCLEFSKCIKITGITYYGSLNYVVILKNLLKNYLNFNNISSWRLNIFLVWIRMQTMKF
jgi:hypothetical protein